MSVSIYRWIFHRGCTMDGYCRCCLIHTYIVLTPIVLVRHPHSTYMFLGLWTVVDWKIYWWTFDPSSTLFDLFTSIEPSTQSCSCDASGRCTLFRLTDSLIIIIEEVRWWWCVYDRVLLSRFQLNQVDKWFFNMHTCDSSTSISTKKPTTSYADLLHQMDLGRAE